MTNLVSYRSEKNGNPKKNFEKNFGSIDFLLHSLSSNHFFVPKLLDLENESSTACSENTHPSI